MSRKLRDVSMFVILVVLLPSCVFAHGRLRVPPSRSSMWRDGYNNPTNTGDNALYCGGFSYQKARGGKCGVCGDPWDRERQNEAGGKYANGIITRNYTKGSQIEASVEITAHHKGWFEFSLCPTNNKNIAATEECLQVLPLADGSGTRYMLPTNGAGFYKVTLQLPSDVVCSQCVFRWKYNAGNNWGKGEDGISCTGCGPQEQFYGCADISIKDTKRSTSTTKQPTLKPGSTPTPACQSYAPVGQHTGDEFMEDYCNFVCYEQEGDNCKPAYCKCRTELECVAKAHVVQAPGMDEFCTHLCRNSDVRCSIHCVCNEYWKL